jgi:hypothetical protein
MLIPRQLDCDFDYCDSFYTCTGKRHLLSRRCCIHSRSERGARAGYLYSFRANTYVYVLVFQTRDLLARARRRLCKPCVFWLRRAGTYIIRSLESSVRTHQASTFVATFGACAFDFFIDRFMCFAYYYCPLNRLTCCSSVINFIHHAI